MRVTKIGKEGIFVVGIDEAGRGSCIGPLVICGVKIKKDDFYMWNIKESKQLNPEKREEIAQKIKNTLLYSIQIISVQKINSSSQSLTALEIEGIKAIIRELLPFEELYVDKLGGLSRENFIKKLNLQEKIKIYYLKKGDIKNKAIALASILAKVHRDKEIKKLRIGVSGYPNEKTNEFLRKIIQKTGKLPEYVRKNYKNVIKISTLTLPPE